jgi:hypothetical protein
VTIDGPRWSKMKNPLDTLPGTVGCTALEFGPRVCFSSLRHKLSLYPRRGLWLHTLHPTSCRPLSSSHLQSGRDMEAMEFDVRLASARSTCPTAFSSVYWHRLSYLTAVITLFPRDSRFDFVLGLFCKQV